jgi:DNA (cytosine-5)-methyltransferase 1
MVIVMGMKGFSKKLSTKHVKAGESSAPYSSQRTCLLSTRSRLAVRETPQSQAEKTVAEFFAGIGLMRMGLQNAGWRVIFANDIDVEKRQMYAGHFKDAIKHFKPGDIHELPAEVVPTVTLATASFPCNDLSLAGARQGLNGKQSSAFWGFVSIIKDMGERRPPLLLIENVLGFLSANDSRDFHAALSAINDLGYTVDPFIMDAAWFVPQSRQRLFIVAVRGEDENIFVRSSTLRPPILMRFIHAHPEIKWNLSSLPTPQKKHSKLADILEDLPDDALEWWSRERAEYFLNQMSRRHQEIAKHMIAQRRFSYATAFRRVRNGKSMAEIRVDGLAGCLRTPRGGSGRQILFKAGFGKYSVRLITPRECARLMGADDFTITGSLNQALFGFGDAVCVPVIQWIAEQYLNFLVNHLTHEYV